MFFVDTMSRCFPFPPPGYEKKARIEDLIIPKKVGQTYLEIIQNHDCIDLSIGIVKKKKILVLHAC